MKQGIAFIIALLILAATPGVSLAADPTEITVTVTADTVNAEVNINSSNAEVSIGGVNYKDSLEQTRISNSGEIQDEIRKLYGSQIKPVQDYLGKVSSYLQILFDAQSKLINQDSLTAEDTKTVFGALNGLKAELDSLRVADIQETSALYDLINRLQAEIVMANGQIGQNQADYESQMTKLRSEIASLRAEYQMAKEGIQEQIDDNTAKQDGVNRFYSEEIQRQQNMIDGMNRTIIVLTVIVLVIIVVLIAGGVFLRKLVY